MSIRSRGLALGLVEANAAAADAQKSAQLTGGSGPATLPAHVNPADDPTEPKP